jgi:hypothetical protein
MAKLKKSRAEIEAIIVAEVRRYPHCEGFKSISIYIIIDGATDRQFTWALSVANYGNAGQDSCDAALLEVIPRLQRQYDVAVG